jgi:hypothetical protein
MPDENVIVEGCLYKGAGNGKRNYKAKADKDSYASTQEASPMFTTQILYLAPPDAGSWITGNVPEKAANLMSGNNCSYQTLATKYKSKSQQLVEKFVHCFSRISTLDSAWKIFGSSGKNT